MHFFWFGEADCLSRQALNSCSEWKVFVFYFLRVFLADHMLVLRNELRVTGPIVCIVIANVEYLETGYQLLANFVLAPPKNKRQNATRRGINGVPQPALILLVADITPLLVKLRTHRNIKEMAEFNGNLARADIGIHRDDIGGLFFISEITVFLAIPRTRAVSRIPLPFMAISTIWSLTPVSYARYMYSALNMRLQSLQRRRWTPFWVP